MPQSNQPDYYEILQVGPNAEEETIYRVYRILAARFHPDNPKTGNLERFLALKAAYTVLSDPTLRAQYDATLQAHQQGPDPVFELKDFVYGIEGEMNRRLGILMLLYHRRRLNPEKPGISLMDLEQRMAFPREHLNFTLWYLKTRSFVCMEQNSDFSLTVAGLDYLEENSTNNPLIREMLASGSLRDGKDKAAAAPKTAAAGAASSYSERPYLAASAGMSN